MMFLSGDGLPLGFPERWRMYEFHVERA